MALDENTRPLSASSEALLPSSCPARLGQLSAKPLSKGAQSSIRVVAAETLGGREGVGDRGKVQGSGDICCCPVCWGTWHLLPTEQSGTSCVLGWLVGS